MDCVRNYLYLKEPRYLLAVKDPIEILKITQCEVRLVKDLMRSTYFKGLQFLSLESCNVVSTDFLAHFK